MEDSTDDDSLDTVPFAMRIPTEKAQPDVAAPTARRRRRCSPGRSAAKPRGRGRKAASSSAKEGNSKRGRGRKARATAASSASVAASAGASRKAGHGIQRRAGHSRSGTAEEKTLQDVTTDSEADIDRKAEEYVSNILPDQAMVVYPDRNSGHAPTMAASSCGDLYECSEEIDMSSPRRRGGRPARAAPVRQRRRVAVEGDGRVVSKVLPGRLSSLLPLGTLVRRPSTKLVQLVAQAINESPHQMLRVTHVYEALQNKYPYYKLLDKKDINSWKSSVRHALFQKWFLKLRPKASLCETVRPRSYFWGVNYHERPREWQMPGAHPAVYDVPAGRGEGQQDDESAMFPALHLENEAPTQKVSQEKVPSTSRLELENTIFSPPEPKWLPVHKQRRPSGSRTITECLPGPSGPQPIEQLGSPSSSCSLSNMDLWKQEFEQLDSWPAPEGADEASQPSANATTESTPSVSTMMPTQSTTASLVEAAVDSLEKPWQTQPGEHIVKLQPQDDELQQQDIVMFQQTLQEQQEQHQFQQMQQASIQGCQEMQQDWRDPGATKQGDTMMDFLTTTETGRPTDIFGKFSPQASPRASFGAVGYGTDEPLAPRPALCWSPSSTARPSAETPAPVKQPPVTDTPPAPSQNKKAQWSVPPELARHLADLVRGHGQRSPDYGGETVACLRLPQPEWNRMVQREIYKKFADPGGRITAILVTGQPSSTPPASPSIGAEGEDEWGEADFLNAVQEDFPHSPPPTDGYKSKSPPLYFGQGLKQEFLFQ